MPSKKKKQKKTERDWMAGMELKDYTGKLNTHAAYLDAITCLEKKCRYIEYVLIMDDTTFVNRFRQYVIGVQAKNQWWGTQSGMQRPVYRLNAVP